MEYLTRSGERVTIVREYVFGGKVKVRREDGTKDIIYSRELVGYTPPRRKPIKQKSKDKKEERFEKYYGSRQRVDFIKSLECVVPGCRRYNCDAAHVVSRGAGGRYRNNLVPLCRYHHDRHSNEKFLKEYKIDLKDVAKEVDKLYEYFG